MSNAAREAVISQYCKELRMPAIRREYPSLARQAADAGLPYEDYLRELLEAEVLSRRDRAVSRRLKEAHFPDTKTVDQIDWKALKGVSRPKILELASGEYLDKGEDIVIAGPIGTGKTHLAVALGIEAAKRRTRVRFTRAGQRQLLFTGNDN